MLIEEKSQENGAYKVGLDGFQKIYRFVARSVERSGQSVQIVLFTLNDGNRSPKDMPEAMKNLADAASKSLRRGDVVAKYGNYQYVVILIGADSSNGKIAAKRTVNEWNKIQKNQESDISISYEMQSIEAKSEDVK